MKKHLFIFSILILLFSADLLAQKPASACKLHREYKNKNGFRPTELPKFLISAVRLIVKDENASTILKAAQKARIITHTDKIGTNLNDRYFREINERLDSEKYKLISDKNPNIKLYAREGRNSIKELVYVGDIGPNLQYIVLRGRLDKDEVNRLSGMMEKAGINVKGTLDTIMNELGDLLKQIEPKNSGDDDPK